MEKHNFLLFGVKLQKCIIKNLDLTKWNSLIYDDNKLFICNKDEFPIMKYIIPLSQYDEFDGDGSKFDFQKALSDIHGINSSVAAEKIPTGNWLTVDTNLLTNKKCCDIVIVLTNFINFEAFDAGECQIFQISNGLSLQNKKKKSYEHYLALCFNSENITNYSNYK